MSDELTGTNVEMGRLEGLLVDLNKSINTQQETGLADAGVEVIVKGADAIVSQNKEGLETLTKGLDVVLNKLGDLFSSLQGLEEKVSNLQGLEEKVNKGLLHLDGLQGLEEKVNQIASTPLPTKAVTATSEEAPAEIRPVAEQITKGDVMTKCLAELKTAGGERKAQLLKGISYLDSNFNPASVAADLNL